MVDADKAVKIIQEYATLIEGDWQDLIDLVIGETKEKLAKLEIRGKEGNGQIKKEIQA